MLGLLTPLEGVRVRLEPLRADHADDLYAAFRHDDSIWKYRPVVPPRDSAEMAALIAAEAAKQRRGDTAMFAQIDQCSGRAVGTTSYLNVLLKDHNLEIGATWIGRPWQRTGINPEAKLLLLTHAFEEMNIVRVQFKMDARNVQATRSIERLGAIHEGTLRKHILMPDGHWRTTFIYSILDNEWPTNKERLLRQQG